MWPFRRRPKKDQLRPNSVLEFVAGIYKQKGIVLVIEPGYLIRSGEENAAIAALTEFRDEPRLGLLYGIGRGHAYIRAEAIKAIGPGPRGGIRHFVDLASALREAGYLYKQVRYLHVDPC